MLVGMGSSAADWDTIEARVGAPLQARRSYDDRRVTTANRKVLEDYQAGRRSVYSMKPDDLAAAARGDEMAQLESALRAVPTDHKMDYMEWHEPENDRIDPDDYRAMQHNAWLTVRKVNIDRVVPIRFGGCLMAYTGRKGWAPTWTYENWRFISWDGYDWDGVLKTASSIFGPCADFCDAQGMRFGVAETGSDRVNRDTNQLNTGRVEWIRQSRVWAVSRDAKWWLYWSNDDNELVTDAEFQAMAP